MKAGVLFAPRDIRYVEVSTPVPAAGELLIKTACAGICSSDLPRAMDERGAYHYPLVMGHEVSGIIESIGSGVQGRKVGERVTVFPLIPCGKCKFCQEGRVNLCSDYGYIGSRKDGGFAEYFTCPSQNALNLPDSVGLDSGAMAEPAAVALHGARRAGIKKGDKVVVLGAGTIGLFAMQWAKYFGANATLIDRNSDKLEIGKKLGADKIIQTQKDKPLEESLANMVRTFDIVLECTGSDEAQCAGITLLVRGGTLVFLGNPHTDLVVQKSLLSTVIRGELALLGSWNSTIEADWREVVSAMAEARIDCASLITRREKLSNISEVFKSMASRSFPNIKVLFELE